MSTKNIYSVLEDNRAGLGGGNWLHTSRPSPRNPRRLLLLGTNLLILLSLSSPRSMCSHWGLLLLTLMLTALCSVSHPPPW